jgi:hypothetical protein
MRFAPNWIGVKETTDRKTKVEDIMKRPIKRKTNKRTANKVKGISISDPDYVTMAPVVEPFDGVWSGRIARLRFYDSSQWVQAFLAPGNNDNLIGTTNNPTLMKMLFLARDNGRVIEGFTANNVIGFIDYWVLNRTGDRSLPPGLLESMPSAD